MLPYPVLRASAPAGDGAAGVYRKSGGQRAVQPRRGRKRRARPVRHCGRGGRPAGPVRRFSGGEQRGVHRRGGLRRGDERLSAAGGRCEPGAGQTGGPGVRGGVRPAAVL